MAPYCGFDQMNVKLLKFLVEQSTNATAPLVVIQLCQLFADTQQEGKGANFYRNRILRFRNKIHQIDELDMDAKVKLLFAISVPVDSYFLDDLRKDADVTVDDRDRITHYKKKNGDLELEGKHFQHVSRSASEKDEKLVELIAKKAQTATTPLRAFALAEEFIDLIGGVCKKNVAFRIREIGRELWTASKFDKQTRIKMLFLMAVPLHERTLAELREDATVDVDDKKRIKLYLAKDGSLKLEGKPKDKVWRRAKQQAKRPNLEYSEPEIPVARRRESTPPTRPHVDSASKVSDNKPPRTPRAEVLEKEQPRTLIEKTEKAGEEKERSQSDDLIYEDPDVPTPPPIIIKRAKPQAKRPNLKDSQAKLPVKQRRKSTPSARCHVDSTSQLPNNEPPQKTKAKKNQPETKIEKTGKADKEKEKNQADDLIYEDPDVLTQPPMIIKREPSVPSNSLKTEPVATVESKPFRIETPPPTHVPLEDAEKIDSKELLNSLRNLVCTLDSPFLGKLQKSMETTIKNYKEEKWISAEDARTTFNYSLLIANRNAPEEVKIIDYTITGLLSKYPGDSARCQAT
ncbi:unnamed protein product [Caenorhabditis nigoni]